MGFRPTEEAESRAQSRGYIVDPQKRAAWLNNQSEPILSDALSDSEAPPRSLVTYRNGKKEYVPESALDGKVLALLFGANGPLCCGFARNFAKVYKKLRREESDPFEVIYVSKDNSRRDFDRFVKGMPWLALPFRDNTFLFERYKVPDDVLSWPRMVILTPDNRVMFEDAVPIAKECMLEKKPEAFSTVLETAWSDRGLINRFNSLFGPW
mmetsp:Transcript_23285/g.51126  ORF Transcript_23285/g.51126 Transcript_23285/m.51126 type:complete len:210 (-) Transcript_23285:111-740(-)